RQQNHSRTGPAGSSRTGSTSRLLRGSPSASAGGVSAASGSPGGTFVLPRMGNTKRGTPARTLSLAWPNDSRVYMTGCHGADHGDVGALRHLSLPVASLLRIRSRGQK